MKIPIKTAPSAKLTITIISSNYMDIKIKVFLRRIVVSGFLQFPYTVGVCGVLIDKVVHTGKD